MTRRIRITVAAIVSSVLLVALGAGSCQSSSVQSSGQKQTEDAFAQQQAAVPYPVSELKDSLERRNVRERLLRTNEPNKLGYVYLLSFSGTPLGYYLSLIHI